MARNPTYEELAQRVKELEKEAVKRKQAEEAVRESEEKFRLHFENVSDVIYSIDPELRILSVSPSVEGGLGYSPEELIGKSFRDLNILAPDSLEPAISNTMRVLANEQLTGLVYEFIAKDGTSKFGEVNSAPLVRNGKIIAVVSVARDITERKRAEREKEKLEAQLQQAQKMEAIGTLAGGIAHDFNNVLMGIQGHTSLLLLHLGPDHPYFEHFKGIEEMVKKGAGLTKQLLGLARGGKYEVKPVDLNELIEKSAEMFGYAKKEITIHRKCQKDIWPVEVDPGQIEQVLLNLYVNAWHAMPAGGDLYIETSNVVLDENYTGPFGMKPGNSVKISVTDTGVGIDEATQQRIFDPFFTTKEMGRGTGLGLASAYGIIENHGGSINVYSKKGEGTTFNIYLPASHKEVTIEQTKRADEILKGTETVLLVDDESVVLDVGEKMLKEVGYNVMVAKSGKEAVEIYGKNKDKIHLVILDMIMPGIGGGEVYDKIKENSPDAKVLLATGYSINGQASEILKRGCDGFIQKPFTAKELSETIRQILDKK